MYFTYAHMINATLSKLCVKLSFIQIVPFVCGKS